MVDLSSQQEQNKQKKEDKTDSRSGSNTHQVNLKIGQIKNKTALNGKWKKPKKKKKRFRTFTCREMWEKSTHRDTGLVRGIKKENRKMMMMLMWCVHTFWSKFFRQFFRFFDVFRSSKLTHSRLDTLSPFDFNNS